MQANVEYQRHGMPGCLQTHLNQGVQQLQIVEHAVLISKVFPVIWERYEFCNLLAHRFYYVVYLHYHPWSEACNCQDTLRRQRCDMGAS